MPTTYKRGGAINVGDVVCTGNDPVTGELVVYSATRARLATSRAIVGVARTLVAPNLVDVFVLGEGADSSTTGLPAGISTLVATDYYVDPTNDNNPAQAKLVRLPLGEVGADGAPHEPPTRAEYIVGTCDANGNVAIQPVHRGTTHPVRYDVRTFGAVGNRVHDDLKAFGAAIDAMAAAGARRGAVLELPPAPLGGYFLSQNLHVTREMILRGTGPKATILVFPAGKGIVVDQGDANGEGGGGGGCILENVHVLSSARMGILPRTVGPVFEGAKAIAAHDHRYWFLCAKAGTTSGPEPFREEGHVLGELAQGFLTSAKAPTSKILITCLSHGYPNGAWVRIVGHSAAAANGLHQISARTSDTFELDGTTWTADGTGGTVKRTIKIASSSCAGGGANVKIVTESAMGYADGSCVYILDHVHSYVPDLNGKIYVIVRDTTDPNSKTWILQGTGTFSAGSGTDGYLEVGIPDGDTANNYAGAAMWTAHSNSGVTLHAQATVRDAKIEGFTNAGVLVDAWGPLAGGNAEGFQLTNLELVDCGMGVGVAGTASSSGSGWHLAIRGMGKQVVGADLPWKESDAAGYGIHDASSNGCTWVGVRVSSSTGASYVAGDRLAHLHGGGTARSVFVGGYTAPDTPRPKIYRPAMLLAGASDPEENMDPSAPRGAMGMVLRAGRCRNVNFRTEFSKTSGGMERDFAPTAFWFQHDDDGEKRLLYLYVAKAADDKEWCFVYSDDNVGTARALISFPVQRSRAGKGNWRDVHGHFTGDADGARIFVGPASALTDKHIRGGGKAISGKEQFRKGDTFWFPQGKTGTFAAWIVKTAGFRGVGWAPNTDYSDDGTPSGAKGLVADMIEPRENNPAAPAGVYKCVRGGRSGAVEPPWPDPPADFTSADLIEWKYMGPPAQYNRTGLVRAEGEDDLDQKTVATVAGTMANVDAGVRGGRTRTVSFTGAAATVSGFRKPTVFPGTTAQLVVTHPSGITFLNDNAGSTVGNRLEHCPAGQVHAATFVYKVDGGTWFCISATP